MRYANKGFTLIELITVIVILGALAAVVTPRFIDLQKDADIAAAQGVAGNLASASATNFAAVKANSSKAVTVTQCGGILDATVEKEMPADFSFTDSTKSIGTAGSSGDTADCAVAAGNSAVTATFKGIRVETANP